MKYVLKQRLFSIGDDFSVLDEHGKECYYFDGQTFTIGKKMIIKDPSKEEVARVQQKLFTFSPTFLLKKGDKVIAKISKKLFTFRPCFLIDVTNGENITIIGKLAEHNYRFLREKKEIATCSKRWFKSKDTYGIDVKNSGDALIVLAAAAVVDMVQHPKRDSGFSTNPI